MIPKQLANSPEPILELEFHIEKFTNFAIFSDNFCLRQRAGAIWCKKRHSRACFKAHRVSKNNFLTSKILKSVLIPPKYPRNIQETILDPNLGSILRNPKSKSTARCRGHHLTLYQIAAGNVNS